MSLKKQILIICLLALFLCGCAAAPGQEAPSQAQATEPATEPASLYAADSEIESLTQGAVRSYLLEDADYTGVFSVGSKLMLVSKEGQLLLLQGENGQIAATAQTDMSAAWGSGDLFVGSQNIGYYAADTQEAVILDHTLREIYRIPLPEEMQGKPIIQMDKGEIFYCTTGQIRAINVQSGISRLVRGHACISQELVGSYFDDTVIGCRIVDEQGQQSVLYLDAKTGQELASDPACHKLTTYDQWYYAVRPGEESCPVFGSSREDWMQLNAQDDALVPVLPAKGVVHTASDELGLHLAMYDLTTGTRSGEVTLPGPETGMIAATEDGCVWILAGQTLYRWNPADSPSGEDTVYTREMFSADRPDGEGLALCSEEARRLSQTYGFTLRIWEEAAQAGEACYAEAEYRVPETQQALTQLEQVLKTLPEGFMTLTGDVQVNLVKHLQDDAQRILYWQDGACHLFLTAQNTTDSFLWGLGNAVDTRVLGNSFDYDKWEELNPWWFDYTYDYEENLRRNDPEDCLEGGDRYFTDLTAMSYPTEDRSRIFANAMLEDNAAMFESSHMQKKLRCVCVAIREAYGWEESTEIFPWEQYLSKPIAAD